MIRPFLRVTLVAVLFLLVSSAQAGAGMISMTVNKQARVARQSSWFRNGGD